MPTLAEIREQYPQYSDMPDEALADALHQKFYSDVPRDEFNAKLGLKSTITSPETQAKPARPAELRAYEPSLRDRIGQFLMPDERASPMREKVVEMLVGSRGLGHSNLSMADIFPPTGVALAGDEANRAAQKGDYLDAGLNLLGVLPAPGVKQVVKSAAEGFAREAVPDAARTATRAPTPGRLDPSIPTRQQIAEAATAEGIKIPVAAATGSTALKQIAGAAAEVPFAGRPLVKASQKAVEDIGARVGQISENYSASPGGAGDHLREAARDWIERGSKETSERIYARVEGMINTDSPSPLNNTRMMAGKLRADMVESTGRAANSTIERVREAINRPQGLTYNGIKNLRSEIGELIGKSGVDTNLSQGALKQIYSALTQDLQFAISRSKRNGGGGQAALVEFQRANKLYSDIKDRQKILADIVGANYDAPAGTIVERIRALAGSKGGADVNRLAQARLAVGPEAWDGVAAAIINHMGDTKNGFSIPQFRTAYHKLSEEGKRQLFGATGKANLKESLDRLSVIGHGAEQLLRMANTSGSGRMGAIVAGSATIGAGLFAPAALLGMLAGAGQTYLVSRALARPVTAKALADAGDAALQAVRTSSPEAMRTYGLAVSQLMRLIGPEVARENNTLPDSAEGAQ